MTDLRLRKRHRLRQKEIAALSHQIDNSLGTKSFSELDAVDMAEGPEYDVVFVDGKILAFMPGGTPFLTIRGLLRYDATKRFVTVDMGAVKFVYNGADVMGPGIVATDSEIKEGDLVWIRDVKNLRPLAVGRALVPAETMVRKEKGKAVASVHHVGDKLWLVDEEKEPEKEEPARD
ncbi:MAG: PUA domain-containing protein [Thermoplasmatota archaeon]|nr:RNA-binding protein [Candidatus Thermoplasmatota archaeon]